MYPSVHFVNARPRPFIFPGLDRFILELQNGLMDFKKWLTTLPGAPTPSIAAKAAGLAGPTLLRHAERGHSTADNVITIARAYGVPPVDALVDTGFLRLDEVAGETISLQQAFARATMNDAMQLLVDKLNESGLFEGTLTVADLEAEANSAPILKPADDELARRRSNGDGAHVDPVVDDGDGLLDRINDGSEPFAAQKRTPPLDENFT